MRRYFYSEFLGGARAVALLAVRLAAGVAFMKHGWDKIQHPMSWMGPDAPVPGFLQMLAAVSEFGGGLAWILGLLTPLFSFGLLCTMAFATLAYHVREGHYHVAPATAHDAPSYELALAYLVIAFLLMIVGPGRLSIDSMLFGMGPIIKPDAARELSS